MADFKTFLQTHVGSQEVGDTLIGEDGLVVMAGAESVEWYQIRNVFERWLSRRGGHFILPPKELMSP